MHRTLFGKLFCFNPKYSSSLFKPIHLHDPCNFYNTSHTRNIIFDDMEGRLIFSYVNIGTIKNVNFIYRSDILLYNDSNTIKELYVYGFKNVDKNPYTSYYHKLTLNDMDAEI